MEAGIASVHAAAATWERTDWQTIADYYDTLAVLQPSPVVTLNRAIALAMWQGAEAGLEALKPLAGENGMARYLPYHLALGDLEARAGRRAAARAAFERALALPMSRQERKLVEKKLLQASDA